MPGATEVDRLLGAGGVEQDAARAVAGPDHRRLRGRTRLAGAQDDPAGEPVRAGVQAYDGAALELAGGAGQGGRAAHRRGAHRSGGVGRTRRGAGGRRGAQRRGRPGHRRRGCGRGGLAGRPGATVIAAGHEKSHAQDGDGRQRDPGNHAEDCTGAARGDGCHCASSPIEIPGPADGGCVRGGTHDHDSHQRRLSSAAQVRRAAQPRLPAVPRRRGSRDDGRQHRARHHLLRPGLVLHRRLDAVGRTVVRPTSRSAG